MKKAFLVLSVLCIMVCSINIYIQAEENPHLKKGEELFNEKKYEQAIEEYKKGLTTDRKDDKKTLLAHIGYTYQILNKFNEAAGYYDESLKIDPDNLFSIEMLGILYLAGLKDYEKGMEYNLKAERLGSKNSMVYYNMACYYSVKNNKEKAFKYLDITLYYSFRNIEFIKSDADFANIRSDARFVNLVNNFNYILEGDASYRLGAIYFIKSDYENSTKFCLDAIEKYNKVLWTGSLNFGSLYNILGAMYGFKKDYNRAISYYEKILKIRLEVLGEKHPDTASGYNNLGLAYSSKGDYGRAIEYNEKALKIRLEVLGENHPDTASGYNNLGSAYHYKGDYGRAIMYYDKALAIKLKVLGEKHPDTASGYNYLGLAYKSKGDYDRAIEYNEKALKIRLEVLGENHPDTIASYSMLGSAYYSKGDYDRAIEYHEKALGIRLKVQGEKHPDTATSYNDLGWDYIGKGDYDMAIEYHEKALGIKLKVLGEKHPDTASGYNDLGSAYHYKGDYDRAIKYYEKALGIRLEVLGEKHPLTTLIYNNLGLAYERKGDYDRAIEYHEKSLKIRLEVLGEMNSSTAVSYNDLGLDYDSKGDYDRAIMYYEKALGIRLEVLGEKHPDTATSYNNLGAIYVNKGDYDRAKMYYEKAQKIWLKIFGEKHTYTAIGYNNLGSIYDSKGDYDRAIMYYEKALGIRLEILGEKHPDTATSYNNLGAVYYSKGDYNKAINHLTKGLLILKEKESNQEIVTGSQNLGLAYIETTQYKSSYLSFLTAIETIEKVRKLNLSGGSDFTSRNINSFYFAANASFLGKDLNSMFNVSERMRAMGYLERLSLKAAIEAAGIEPEQGTRLIKLKDDIERLSSLRQKLISMNIYELNSQQKKGWDRQFEQASKDLAQAEEDFIKLDSGFMKNEKYKLLRDTSVVTVDEAQKLCGKDSAIIEYIIPNISVKNEYMKYLNPYAIVITGTGINAVKLDSSYNFTEKIEKYRIAIRDSDQNDLNVLSVELYRKLVDPVNSYINSKDIKRFIIVPDGSLAFLPFDSLKSSDNKYLSEKYEINLTPSVTVSAMTRNRKYAKRNNLMAFGGGLYSTTGETITRGKRAFRGMAIESKQKEKLAIKAYNSPLEYYKAQDLMWPDLPGTEKEVSVINDQIYNQKNTEVYKGSSVSEENLKSLSRTGKLKGYSSIHLACHGYYDPEYPAYSAIVLSEVSGKLKNSKDDGYLSVEETALLNLQSDIVVLSACETGMGKIINGDGVIGLTRAFQVAGSNRVLVTLWSVSDEATEKFMISFYSKIKTGMDYREALVKVKDEFRRSGIYNSPYFWAGFVLYE